ncbi:MAG: hypothetical protein EOS23_32915 [Mesorhizobium sp.]|nr:MAG: hypothetical protein EOS23_32915 [Mesorhizobium sp.]
MNFDTFFDVLSDASACTSSEKFSPRKITLARRRQYMQHILERLTAKIRQADSDQQYPDKFRLENPLDHHLFGEILPRLPGDDLYRFTGHPSAMFPDGGGLTEKIAKRQKTGGSPGVEKHA